MTEHTPPTAAAWEEAEIALREWLDDDDAVSALQELQRRGFRPPPREFCGLCPSCGYEIEPDEMRAFLAPDENGISHTEPAALPETPSAAADEAMRAIVIAARDAWLANWTTATLQRLEATLSKSLSEAWPETPSASTPPAEQP